MTTHLGTHSMLVHIKEGACSKISQGGRQMQSYIKVGLFLEMLLDWAWWEMRGGKIQSRVWSQSLGTASAIASGPFLPDILLLGKLLCTTLSPPWDPLYSCPLWLFTHPMHPCRGMSHSGCPYSWPHAIFPSTESFIHWWLKPDSLVSLTPT